MIRKGRENYYLDIAETILTRGTCLRRNFGAVIVNNDQIISSGYTGAPRGRKNCIESSSCLREQLNVPKGERYELCRSVHAEANAIIHASRNDMMGGTLYLAGKNYKTLTYVRDALPCDMCKRLIINSGLARVIVRNNSRDFAEINVNFWVDLDESLMLQKDGY
ncbi:MAG: dCMP deaminase family protein [Oscillospiraceae bacterium]|nr:dCMP deaminase family protein [Oscillospiraceae bacterium]